MSMYSITDKVFAKALSGHTESLRERIQHYCEEYLGEMPAPDNVFAPVHNVLEQSISFVNARINPNAYQRTSEAHQELRGYVEDAKGIISRYQALPEYDSRQLDKLKDALDSYLALITAETPAAMRVAAEQITRNTDLSFMDR